MALRHLYENLDRFSSSIDGLALERCSDRQANRAKKILVCLHVTSAEYAVVK